MRLEDSPSPIIIMSFNRPTYLKALLSSLQAQKGVDLRNRVVALFQDGSKNRYVDKPKADIADIEECIRAFQEMIPHGQVFASRVNLGVAMNYERAETFAFTVRGDDAAIFLEDDLLPAEHYIAILDGLIATHLHDSRVGYMAAYGDHHLPLEAQELNKNNLMTMHHNWGFVLYRRHWEAMRPYLLQYLQLVRDRDYSQRDHGAIAQLFLSWGYVAPGTSQDCAKTVITCVVKAIKLNTVACFARYIGKEGLHMHESLFHEWNYSLTQVLPELIKHFEPVSDGLYANVFAELERWGGQDRYTTNSDSQISVLSRYRYAHKRRFAGDSLSAASVGTSAMTRLLWFFEGANLSFYFQRMLHIASNQVKREAKAEAVLVASVALKLLFKSMATKGVVCVAFRPLESIVELSAPNHLLIDRQDGHVRITCPSEMLTDNFTNHYEALVVVAALTGAFTSTDVTEAAFVVDLGAGGGAGAYPRASFSSTHPLSKLIVDTEFFHSRAYSRLKDGFRQAWIPWKERDATVMWRGISTGRKSNRHAPASEWAWLQRLDLCSKARTSAHCDKLDVGITRLIQIESVETKEAIVAAGFLRSARGDIDMINYQYAFVIDCNTSAKNGMLKAMLAGCCVLLIESRFRFQSWYYDRLEAWKTHVPVRADLSDMDERLDWIFSHPIESERIAEEGLRFAQSLAFDRECEQSVNTLRAALLGSVVSTV